MASIEKLPYAKPIGWLNLKSMQFVGKIGKHAMVKFASGDGVMRIRGARWALIEHVAQ